MNPLILFYVIGWLGGWFIGYQALSSMFKPKGFNERVSFAAVTSVLWIPSILFYAVYIVIRSITNVFTGEAS